MLSELRTSEAPAGVVDVRLDVVDMLPCAWLRLWDILLPGLLQILKTRTSMHNEPEGL